MRGESHTRSLAEVIAETGFLPEAVSPADINIVNQALTSLFAKLREASKLYRDKPDHGRTGTVVALRAIMEFLLRFRSTVTDELHLPLTALASALVGLDHNKLEPILKRTQRSGRAPDSPVRQVMVGTAVGAVKQLEFIGIPTAEARKAVAATLARQGIIPSRGTAQISSRTIREWSERVRADTAGRSPASKEASRMMSPKWQCRLSSKPREEARTAVLRALSESIRRAKVTGANT
jgi:hypothetical protein